MREHQTANDLSGARVTRAHQAPTSIHSTAAAILSLQAVAGNRSVAGMLQRDVNQAVGDSVLHRGEAISATAFRQAAPRDRDETADLRHVNIDHAPLETNPGPQVAPTDRNDHVPYYANVQRTPSKLQAQFATHSLVNLSLLDQIRRSGWNAYIIQLKQYWNIPDDELGRRLSAFPHTYRIAKRMAKAYGHEFGVDEQALVAHINDALERERCELSELSSTRLAPERAFYKGASDDPQIENDRHHTVLEDSEEIFAQEPCMGDVLQGGLGDCYLLAAVSSIVQKDPNHFKSHIIDNFDGTVTVKFYKEPGMVFPTTVLKSVADGKYARESLWVQLLEKAYVASGLQSKPLPSTSDSDGASSAYTQIAGGRPHLALMHLTGLKTTSAGVGKARKEFRVKAGEQSSSNPILEKLKEKIRQEQSSASAPPSAESLQFSELQGAIMELMNLVAMVYLSQKDIEDFVTERKSIIGFPEFMAELGPLSLPGPLGSGEYGEEESEAFEIVRSAIDDRRPIVATTKNVISDPKNKEEKDKGRAGEVKVAGLAAGHAYSIIDYRKPSAEDQRILVQLRNPWGEYGRNYVRLEEGSLHGVAEEKGNGEFWLDLGDLVAYFDDLSTTTSTPETTRR